MLKLAGLISILLAGSASAQTYCGGTGHYYQIVESSGISWSAANRTASARSYNGMPGHLVSILTIAENDFVSTLFGHGFVWLGGHQLPGSTEPGGGWGWLTGEPWTYGNWAQGEPNDDGQGQNENALAYGEFVGGFARGDLPDNGGNASIRGYIVEYENPILLPQTFQVFRGILLSGILADLLSSDGEYMVIKNGLSFNAREAPIQMVVTMTSPVSAPSALVARFKAHVSAGGLLQTIQLWDLRRANG